MASSVDAPLGVWVATWIQEYPRENGISEMVGCSCNGAWRQRKDEDECYAVRKPIMKDILFRLQCPPPTVDAFANRALHMCDRWWGEGGEVEDAFIMDWGQEQMLWVNPPFSRLNEVIPKLVDEQARGILIMPHWKNQMFFDEVWKIVQKKHYYPRGSRVFETVDGVVGGVKWPVWALYVDGTKPRPVRTRNECSEEDDPKPTKTSACRRRWRRKFIAHEIC